MPSISSWLSDLSRSKLDVAASGRDGWRDTLNLRRFVLLKNSITHAETPPLVNHSTAVSTSIQSGSTIASSDVLASEEAWLESVLETLEEFDNELHEKIDAVQDDPLLESQLDDPFECWVDGYAVDDDHSPFSLSSAQRLPSLSPVLSSFQSPISFQYFLNSSECPLNQIEPRYPEADFDLPLSDTSSVESDDEDDDDGPLTPFSGSQPSLRDKPIVEPQVYSEPDSYFLYPSELDLISVPPDFQHC